MSKLTFRGELGFATQRINAVHGCADGDWMEWLVRPQGLDTEQFIAAVESLEETLVLDRLVTVKALSWLEHQPSNTRLSVNVFASTISQPEFLEFVLQQLDQYAISSDQLCFEITEHHAITHLGTAQVFCQRVRATGVLIALDDVGNGTFHSGLLGPLKMVDCLKVDRNWVAAAPASSVHRDKVQELIALARENDLIVVVEGIETEQHLEMARELGAEFYQGYLDGMPAAVEWSMPSIRKVAS
jgi:EAL domain-containing protein (putative c-di-GMP-specific phosphodiesterase class I)